MKKLDFLSFCEVMARHKGDGLEGFIVFTADSFTKPYTEKQRTYSVTSNAKYFDGSKCGTSLFGDCLDGTDLGVRLDWYLKADTNPWKVDYCYFN